MLIITLEWLSMWSCIFLSPRWVLWLFDQFSGWMEKTPPWFQGLVFWWFMSSQSYVLKHVRSISGLGFLVDDGSSLNPDNANLLFQVGATVKHYICIRVYVYYILCICMYTFLLYKSFQAAGPCFFSPFFCEVLPIKGKLFGQHPHWGPSMLLQQTAATWHQNLRRDDGSQGPEPCQRWARCRKMKLGGGFKYFLCSPLFGEDFLFDSYFSDGLKPPTRKSRYKQIALLLNVMPIRGSFIFWMASYNNKLHPRKLTCPLKRDYFNRT